jgi:hypothetical protein
MTALRGDLLEVAEDTGTYRFSRLRKISLVERAAVAVLMWPLRYGEQ